MGSILIKIPDFSESDIFIDEEETKAILLFYWPEKASQIATLQVGLDAKKLAQTVLIAGVDASYAIGYIGAIVRNMYNPGKGLASALKKIAKRAAKHWFQHATAQDLADAKIAFSVKSTIKGAARTHFEFLLTGQGLMAFRGMHFFAHFPSNIYRG
jgi:hypothetical protein